MEGNGDRKEVSKRFYPSSVPCTLPSRRPKGSQRRGEVIMPRDPPEPGSRSRSLPVGEARSLPRRLGWSGAHRRAGGLGKLPHPSAAARPLRRESPKHFGGSGSPAAVRHQAAGAASWPLCGSATRVTPLWFLRRRRDAPPTGRALLPPGARGARCPGRQRPPGRTRLSPPQPALALHPCPRLQPSAQQHLDNKSCRRAEWAGLGSAPPAHTPPEPIDVQMPMGPRGPEPRRTHSAVPDPARGSWGRVRAPARWRNCR